MKYKMYIDEFWDDLYSEFEKIGLTGRGHKCVVEAETPEEASEYVSEALKFFFSEYFELVEEDEDEEDDDRWGEDIEAPDGFVE